MEKTTSSSSPCISNMSSATFFQMDKESVLDEAIQYLKCLQLQLQIMPTFAGLCVPPTPFILPTLGSGSATDFSQLFGLPLAGFGTTLEMPINAQPVTSPPPQSPPTEK